MSEETLLLLAFLKNKPTAFLSYVEFKFIISNKTLQILLFKYTKWQNVSPNFYLQARTNNYEKATENFLCMTLPKSEDGWWWAAVPRDHSIILRRFLADPQFLRKWALSLSSPQKNPQLFGYKIREKFQNRKFAKLICKSHNLFVLLSCGVRCHFHTILTWRRVG